MRVRQEFSSFYLPQWTHEIASLLDSEPRDILIHRTYAGSTIIDFEIKDPSPETAAGATNQIRRLSGNEKMLLLYQWWLTNDERMDDFTYDVIDFKAFAQAVSNGDDRQDTEVVQLFAPSQSIDDVEFAPRPDEGGADVQSGFYFDMTTLQITVTVAPADSLHFSILLWAFMVIFALAF